MAPESFLKGCEGVLVALANKRNDSETDDKKGKREGTKYNPLRATQASIETTDATSATGDKGLGKAMRYEDFTAAGPKHC